MQYRQPHIVVKKESNGEIIINIDDVELFDFIEDYLIEKCSIEYAFITVSKNWNRIMHFTDKYSFETIKSAIQSIDGDEIERIYQLNN